MTSIVPSLMSSAWGADVSLGDDLRKKKKEMVSYVITFDDGSQETLKLPAIVFQNKDGSDSRNDKGELFDPRFTKRERLDVVMTGFKQQYDMPANEVIKGVIAHLVGGLSLGTSDEIAGAIGGLVTDKGVAKSIDEQRTILRRLSLKYPYIATTADTMGAAIPIILDTIFGTKVVAAGMQAGRMAQRVTSLYPMLQQMQRVQNLKHPLRIGSSTLLGGGLEAAAKTGTLSAAHQFGAGEGGLWDRAKSMPESFNRGAVLGAGFNTGLLGLAKTPAAYQGIKDWGVKTLRDRPYEAITKSVKDFTGAAYRMARGKDNPFKGVRDDVVGDMMFSEAMPPSTAFRGLTEAKPWDTLGRNRPMLAEGLGLRTFDPDYPQLPTRDPQLPGYLKWGGEADATAGGALANQMREAGLDQPKLIRGGLERAFGPFPRNVDETIGVMRQDARDVWEGFYRDAYFTPAGNPISVPLSGISKGTGFMKMFSDESGLYKGVYEQAKATRATNIAHRESGTINNWDNYIAGIDQHLPSWKMFLAGERYVPKSTWGDNAAVIRRDGWTRLRDTDGTLRKSNGNYIVGQKTKRVDVKTLHDMRIAFDDLINKVGVDQPGRKAVLAVARNKFDKHIKAVAPEALRLADEAFESQLGVQAAAKAGRTATTREYTSPEAIRTEYEALASPQQQRMYLSGLAERLKSDGVTAENILSNKNNVRENIEALFGGDTAKFGEFLQEVSVLKRSADIAKDFGDPARTINPTIGQQFGGLMWTMFAKVPAYHFSTAFAGARDLTIIARNMEKTQNKIVGREMLRILKSKTPEELATVLSELDAQYRRSLPKDAEQLRKISALLMSAVSVNEEDLYPATMRGLQAAGRGLLGAF